MKRYNFTLSPDYALHSQPKPGCGGSQVAMPLTFFFAVSLAGVIAWIAWFG